MSEHTCSVDGCGKPICVKIHGLCSTHYHRWRRTGNPLTPLQRQPNVGPCSVDGCDQPMRKREWCASHYAQWKRYGEVRPFRYKWAAEGSACVVCGGQVPKGSRRRKHCSGACQQADSRWRNGPRPARRPRPTGLARPTIFVCRLCRKEVSLQVRHQNGRLLRADVIWCRDCGRESPDAIRYKRYGITPSEYLSAVERGCPICKRTGVKLHVDHDHSCCGARKHRLCGKCTRGLICGNCNRALGLLRDDAAALEAAIVYLKRVG